MTKIPDSSHLMPPIIVRDVVSPSALHKKKKQKRDVSCANIITTLYSEIFILLYKLMFNLLGCSGN